MARTKQATPLRRDPSSEYVKGDAHGTPSRNPRNMNVEKEKSPSHANGKANGSALAPAHKEAEGPGIVQFLMAVGGIYGSFLTWALLQERLTTTPYGSSSAPELFKFPVFLNTVQSLFAALTGYMYLRSSTKPGQSPAPIFPNQRIVVPLLLVAITSSLASPFGYASLAHIDYITFILAKSCKLLPVMFLHITIFQKRYPLYKYLVVLAVTSGVAVFTLHAGSAKAHKKPSKASINPDRNSTWGLLLLGINLLFDGLTNTTQDYIFQTYQPYTGPQMMCANNIMSTILTLSYLGLSPYLSHTGLGEYLGMDLSNGGSGGEFKAALGFMARHPGVWWDVLGFAACGAVGQVFIFYTLSTFSSLLLVTINVTRKMLTMILSVIWFGHRLGGRQWMGVGLVFGGIGAEGIITRMEKQAKDKKAAGAAKKEL
ncbi:Multidrug resistance efflux transporter EmrE [Venustampulla echinocandica]|uniref:UDP-galactose transporter homolog 1 n=1 Tax=Venustampulla echinocandica TaxID=2656787 RepID=A0A370TYK3_9HELO|nr:Multidrug resistance efflux transporter EmrE [Venustampulla echinocandica]RDL40606.1 Multidrug resistance efflux transporter EmrE [Venustampulla echinocandica]